MYQGTSVSCYTHINVHFLEGIWEIIAGKCKICRIFFSQSWSGWSQSCTDKVARELQPSWLGILSAEQEQMEQMELQNHSKDLCQGAPWTRGLGSRMAREGELLPFLLLEGFKWFVNWGSTNFSDSTRCRRLQGEATVSGSEGREAGRQIPLIFSCQDVCWMGLETCWLCPLLKSAETSRPGDLWSSKVRKSQDSSPWSKSNFNSQAHVQRFSFLRTE